MAYKLENGMEAPSVVLSYFAGMIGNPEIAILTL
jgi:hypothetical protein